MKTIALTLIATLACACASTPKPVSVTAADAPPPTDMEVVMQDKLTQDHQLSERQAALKEEVTYQASLINIQHQFEDEKLKVEMCAEVHGAQSSYCYSFIKKLCEVDELIDTRSGRHPKEYCSKDVLDFMNPSIPHHRY